MSWYSPTERQEMSDYRDWARQRALRAHAEYMERWHEENDPKLFIPEKSEEDNYLERIGC